VRGGFTGPPSQLCRDYADVDCVMHQALAAKQMVLTDTDLSSAHSLAARRPGGSDQHVRHAWTTGTRTAHCWHSQSRRGSTSSANR
jgi:hypothetical protein